MAAAQENLFWAHAQPTVQKQEKVWNVSLKAYAKDVGSTNKKFLDQLVNGIYAWQVREDLLEGLAKGVRNVPAIFLNNIPHEGDLTFSGITEEIERQLHLSR